MSASCFLPRVDVVFHEQSMCHSPHHPHHPQINDNESSSEYSEDDDVIGRSRGEPESKPILSVREYLPLYSCAVINYHNQYVFQPYETRIGTIMIILLCLCLCLSICVRGLYVFF